MGLRDRRRVFCRLHSGIGELEKSRYRLKIKYEIEYITDPWRPVAVRSYELQLAATRSFTATRPVDRRAGECVVCEAALAGRLQFYAEYRD